MVCEACGGRTQPETVIVLRRTLGTLRSTRQAAWYCWTCKASTNERRVPAAMPAPVARPCPRLVAAGA